ncbi:DUF2971 domain-containing protein [Pseudooceanicola nitratireducens]|uniref:DUF2971 domain-containing protein n=1 Tax=Pseudooceanicola nitratireducens TaxID=517719 RepID=UPI003513A868
MAASNEDFIPKIEFAWIDEPTDGYERLFYFCGGEHSVENLEAKKIKVSRFSKCNDLFELSAVGRGDKAFRERHKSWSEKLDKQLGLICLTRNWRNPVMWGHYAQNASGMCWVLDVKSECLRPVKYEARPRKIGKTAPLPELGDRNALFELCSIKSLPWSYEEEWRLFVELDDSAVSSESYDDCSGNSPELHFKSFGDDLQLVGVLNGFASTKTSVHFDACDLAGKVIRTRPSFNSYDIVIQRSRKLQDWSGPK